MIRYSHGSGQSLRNGVERLGLLHRDALHQIMSRCSVVIVEVVQRSAGVSDGL